jgi:hypothetical protein
LESLCGACFASAEAVPLILTHSRTSVTKAVLKPFLVMISAAALLWCVAAMAIHLANAEVPTSIG